ncbi:head-tail connector protein [Alkalimonas sp. NCh-2]|uniref:head-tail connector protein n=1 Tax=Alkalimonas sp. NCh-2 TaxID=3144846 RepID=UPI0031F5FFCD
MISLELAKKHLVVDHDEDDVLIQGLIKAAYLHAENKTNTCFEPKEVTITLDHLPHGAEPIKLDVTPVREVVEFSFVDPQGDTLELPAETMRLDKRPLYPTLAPQFGTSWPKTIAEPESVHITLAVGYEETPADAQAAMLLMIGNWYANRESVVIGTISSSLPMGVSMLLEPYMIRSIG